MNSNYQSEKNKKIRMSLYGSYQGISMLALIIVAAFEVMMLTFTIVNSALYGPYLTRYRMFYVSLLGVALAYIALNIYAKKDIENRYNLLAVANPACSVFFFMWALIVTYSDSLVNGTIDSSVFMTFSMVVPLIFSLIPAVYAVIVILADAAMLYLIITVMGATAPLINVIVFFVFQFVLGIGFLRLKMTLAERIVQEEENARLDVMTGLPNRRVYEEDLKRLAEEPLPDDLYYVVIDINGLKDVNDNYGHETGDRMITVAAQCIEQAFGEWGRQYRIGGDEFVTLLSADREKVDELVRDVKDKAKEWSKGSDVTLSVSCGAAGSPEYPDCKVTDLARAADEMMYEDKSRYYQSIGKERRRNRRKQPDAEASQ